MLSLVFGSAFEVPADDPILGHPNVRVYRQDGRAFVGHDTAELVHVCDRGCAEGAIPREYLQAGSHSQYISIHPANDGETRTVDVVDFDPGDDPYILCEVCGEVLLRDDDKYEAQYGRPIGSDLSDRG